jgi:DNA-binding phage protein
MNSYEIQKAARGFVQQMKDDIRNKLNQFTRETGITIRQMARDLGLNEDDLDRIKNGDGNVSLETFATLIIANGLVLEVKPISEAPIPTHNGVPVPPRNGFVPRNGQMPPPPPGFFDSIRRNGDRPDAATNSQPRDSRGRFMSRTAEPHRPASRPANSPDFASMEREKLIDIIQTKLWDSEIDVNRSSREQLVRFLENKNRRLAELQARKEAENDPAVTELRDKIKATLENNPHLRNVLKNLISE